MTTGYSDRINHALAYAAKHHDQLVRRGTRSPYLTRHANVAVILARYDADDDMIVAGILHDVVNDTLRAGLTPDGVAGRIGQKFGDDALHLALAIAERRADDDGVELAPSERRDDLLQRLQAAPDRARWILAANALHETGTLLAELGRTEFPEAVWERNPRGQGVEWLQRIRDRLQSVDFSAPIMSELQSRIGELSARWTAAGHQRTGGGR
jgi:hypothetical protein